MAGPRGLGGPGFALVDKVRSAIDRQQMLRAGDRVIAAVSGGPDSMCMLDVLARLADHYGIVLEVAHVDHGLGEASAEVSARVAHHAASMGYEVHLIRAPDLAGPNLHARAREFRYAFLDTLAREGAEPHERDPDKIATGHTLDDRVETTLARLIHGAGTAGIAGMRAVEGHRIRPLIAIRRGEARAYCEEVGIAFYDDPANADDRFERASVRAEVLAAIEARWGDGAVRAMARSSERLREDADALAEQAWLLWEGAVDSDAEGNQRLGLATMQGLPRALRRRVLEIMVGRVRDRGAGIDAALDALDRLEGAELPLAFSLPDGIEVVITSDAIETRRAK